MTKTLNDFLEVYKPKSPDEQKFVDKHVTIKHKDRNGNGDDVFNGNTKTIKRKEERHGYDVGEDEKVYEEAELGEDTAGDVVRANHRIMQHQQYIKNIMSADMGNPFQKVIQLRDAKKHLASLHADRQNAMAKHEEEMNKSKVKTRKKKVSESTSNRPSHKDIAYNDPEMIKHREIQRYLDNLDIDRDAARKEKARKEKANEEANLDDLLDEALDILNSIDEKTLTPAEMKKREEVVKAIKRDDPKMDRSMAYAIATKTAKRVAEGTMLTKEDTLDEEINWKAYDVVTKGHDGKTYSQIFDAHGNSIHQKIRDVRKERDNQPGTTKYARFMHDRLLGAYGAWYKQKKEAMKEESEHIDELSKKTLASYANKAAFKIGDQGITAGLKIQNNEPAAKNFKTMGKRQKGIAAAVGKLAKEEVEAIDELSKNTLGSYITKATNQAFGKGYTGGSMKARGIITRDSEEENAGEKNIRKGVKRIDGVNKAVRKLTREEVEAFDEISKNLAQRYISKASDQVDDLRFKAGMLHNRAMLDYNPYDRKNFKWLSPDEQDEYNKHINKADKREKQISLARAKKNKSGETAPHYTPHAKAKIKATGEKSKLLTREDIINRTIEKYVPEDIKFTPEERLLKRINGLSEGHIDTLLGLFEALNSDNQKKMIETVESHEGINQLLNFALENKGE